MLPYQWISQEKVNIQDFVLKKSSQFLCVGSIFFFFLIKAQTWWNRPSHKNVTIWWRDKWWERDNPWETGLHKNHKKVPGLRSTVSYLISLNTLKWKEIREIHFNHIYEVVIIYEELHLSYPQGPSWFLTFTSHLFQEVFVIFANLVVFYL